MECAQWFEWETRLCQNRKPWNSLGKRSAKENRRPPRRANLSGKRSDTFARESTVRVQQSRPSPSVCRRPVVLASGWHLRRKAWCLSKPAGKPNGTWRRAGRTPARRSRGGARVRRCGRCNGKARAPLRVRRWRGTRGSAPVTEAPPTVPRRPGEQLKLARRDILVLDRDRCGADTSVAVALPWTSPTSVCTNGQAVWPDFQPDPVWCLGSSSSSSSALSSPDISSATSRTVRPDS